MALWLSHFNFGLVTSFPQKNFLAQKHPPPVGMQLYGRNSYLFITSPGGGVGGSVKISRGRLPSSPTGSFWMRVAHHLSSGFAAELLKALWAVFQQFGEILDICARPKKQSLRGQAWIGQGGRGRTREGGALLMREKGGGVGGGRKAW